MLFCALNAGRSIEYAASSGTVCSALRISWENS